MKLPLKAHSRVSEKGIGLAIGLSGYKSGRQQISRRGAVPQPRRPPLSSFVRRRRSCRWETPDQECSLFLGNRITGSSLG